MSLPATDGTTGEEAQWLKYSPREVEAHSYNNFLEQLGFSLSSVDKCAEFVKDLASHVDLNTFRYARQSENEDEFRKMVFAFLGKHGAKYWGAENRDHLDELDPKEGFLYPRDIRRSPSRLVEILEAMFDYKAKGVHSYDKTQTESILPHLDLQAMTWPPKEDATVEKHGQKSFTVTINRTPLSTLKWKVLQRSWKPNDTKKARPQRENYEDDESPVSRNRISRPSARVIHYDENSDGDSLSRGSEDWEFDEPPQPMSSAKNGHRKRDRRSSGNRLDERLRKKPKHRVLSSRRKTTSSLGQRSDSATAPNSKSRRGVQQPTPQSARLNMNAQISDSESDVVVLNDVPRRSKIKEERTSVKKEPFSVEITHGTHLVISASNQPDMAPVKTLLGSVSNIEQLYGKLAKDCELQTDRSERSERIIAVSVTFPWSNEKYRLRKGEDEDWDLFKSDLENAWARNSGFKKEGCKVLMLLHVNI